MRPKPYKKADLPPLTVEEQKAELELTATPGKRISIEQYNKEIDEALEQVRNGDFVSHEEVMRDMKKW